MSTAFVFPGQGSQFIGMGQAFADNFATAREVFEEVDEALGEKLSQVIFAGPEEALTSTENTQPALMAVSVAISRVIEKETGKTLSELGQFVAGHSLGEYSALCAAGAISLSDTAKILRIRGRAMQEAVPKGQGGMAALIGVDQALAAKVTSSCNDNGACEIANDNGGGQIVISGSLAAIDKAVEIAGELGIKRAVKLPVSAPFHSSLMQPAAEKMQEALADVKIQAPSLPLIANVTAAECTDPEAIRRQLVEQVTGQVRWRESMEYLGNQGVTTIVEIGAGKVLAGLAKRINRDLQATSVQTPEDMGAWLATC